MIRELDLKLVLAIDTHVHADHITALGRLRDRLGCPTMMGQYSKAECVSIKVNDGETIKIDGLDLKAIHTPGHTDDSFSFVMADRVFTGDALLIRGTRRTDFPILPAARPRGHLINSITAPGTYSEVH